MALKPLSRAPWGPGLQMIGAYLPRLAAVVKLK